MILSKSQHSHRRQRRRNPSSNNNGCIEASTSVIQKALVSIAIFVVATLVTSDLCASSFQLIPKHRRNWYTSCVLSASKTTTPNLGAPICVFHQVDVPSGEKDPVPCQAISVEDLTPTLQSLLEASGMTNGLLTVISRHTTTSLTINEWESRLADDIAETLLKLVPPDERSISPASQKGVTYKHNDIHFRPFGDSSDEDNYNEDSEEARRCRENGWDVDDPVQLEAWREQEPINAHSHLLSILGGSGSESIPVVDGKMVLGQWQSVLLLDLDGPRDRSVGVQLMGYS